MDKQKEPASLLERYGRAILRLEGWEWDDAIGPKPEGFDALPITEQIRIIEPRLQRLRDIVGPVVESYYRHTVDFGGDEFDWAMDRMRIVAEEKGREESYRSFIQERIQRADSCADKPVGNGGFTFFNLLYILLGFAIGVYLV